MKTTKAALEIKMPSFVHEMPETRLAPGIHSYFSWKRKKRESVVFVAYLACLFQNEMKKNISCLPLETLFTPFKNK